MVMDGPNYNLITEIQPGQLPMELWQLARDWLESVGVLPKGKCARFFDFALAIRDGTVLCEAINMVQMGKIAVVHPNPRQLQRNENVSAFLEAARDFGVSESMLCAPESIYDGADFEDLIYCLAHLSQTDNFTKKGIESFPQDVTVPNTAMEDGRDAMSTLSHMIAEWVRFNEEPMRLQSRPQAGGQDPHFILEQTLVSRPEEQRVYDDTVSVEPQAEPTYNKATDSTAARNSALEELVDTEGNYVRQLEEILHLSKSVPHGLAKCGPLYAVFKYVEQLHQAHGALFEALKQTMNPLQGDARFTSKAFGGFAKKMAIYAPYVCEVEAAQAALECVRKTSRHKKNLETAEKERGSRFSLKDLLVVPKQRLTRYHLLLRAVIKHTPKKHPDYNNFCEAIIAVSDLVSHINEYKAERDELESSVTNVMLKYDGRPLHEYLPLKNSGDIKWVRTGKRPVSCYAFLFEKAVVITKLKKAKYEFLDVFELSADMEACEAQDSSGSHPYGIDFIDASNTCHCTVLSRTTVVRKTWLENAKEALRSLKDAECIPPEPGARTPAINPMEAPDFGQGGAAVKADSDHDYEYDDVPPASAGSDEGEPTRTPSKQSLQGRGFNQRWYGGKMTKEEAAAALANGQDGAFVVRERATEANEYGLSVQCKSKCRHIKINRGGDGIKYNLLGSAAEFTSIDGLVEHYRREPLMFTAQDGAALYTHLTVPFSDIGRDPVGAVAKHDYVARQKDELSFQKYDVVQIMEFSDPNWVMAKDQAGRKGLIPLNFFQVLEDAR
eukprot:m.14800 g.14800  ORF g.14800 m.14800 type:complete len:781 (-) comp4831_c0_seq2:206-2548(-)